MAPTWATLPPTAGTSPGARGWWSKTKKGTRPTRALKGPMRSGRALSTRTTSVTFSTGISAAGTRSKRSSKRGAISFKGPSRPPIKARRLPEKSLPARTMEPRASKSRFSWATTTRTPSAYLTIKTGLVKLRLGTWRGARVAEGTRLEIV